MGDTQSLKHALRAAAEDAHFSSDDKLSDTDYANGFALFTSPPNNKVYENLIIPTLRETLTPLFDSRNAVSVLEIGPGPKTILATLPENMRRKINRYTACEPNSIFASKLENNLTHVNEKALPLPGLRDPAQVLRTLYELGEDEPPSRFDVVLFCHSMYGLGLKRKFVEQALKSLGDVGGELVVVFHRAGCLNFNGLVCHRTASSPDSTVSIHDNDEDLNTFASFVTGIPKSAVEPDVRLEWLDICRSQGSSDPKLPGQLVFHVPEIMVAFNKHAGALQDLNARVPLASTPRPIKNREACHTPYAAILTPIDVAQVQECVRWALRHRLNLTVIGGSHSGHCVQPHVVALDMSGFNEVHVINTSSPGDYNSFSGSPLIIVGAGCTAKDIVDTAMQAGLTVPLGSRPSVGMGLALQGGIGHLSRQHGLTCDSIVGAIMVSVETGDVLLIGDVPQAHCPDDAIRLEIEAELLWALRGAGTNFGIVISVVFKAYHAPKLLVRDWVVPLRNEEAAVSMLAKLDGIARDLDRNCSADPCIYVEDDEMHFGVTMFQFSHGDLNVSTSSPSPFDQLLGTRKAVKTVDPVGLFNTNMYMSSMHDGHAGGTTSSFKLCVFLKDIGRQSVARRLFEAIANRPTPYCYLHLLQGGGAIRDIKTNSNAFACRDWDFACVITGV